MSYKVKASSEEVVHRLGVCNLGITHTQKGGKGATQPDFVSNSSAYSNTGRGKLGFFLLTGLTHLPS